MPVFSREAKGNAKPDRVLATPHSTWGIAADETRQQIFLTIQGSNAVIVYRKTAQGNEAPLRILQGDATELGDPQGIAVDAKNNLLVVGNHGARELSVGGPAAVTRTQEEWRQAWQAVMGRAGMHGFVGLTGGRGGQGQTPNLSSLTSNELQGQGQGGGTYGRFELPSINIFSLDASGNTAPLRVIKGPQTQLNWPHHVAVHEDRGEIFVANNGGDSILVFRTSDRGDVIPTRVIKGPGTGLKYPAGIALDITNGELWVANMGNYTATAYPIAANGDVAPLRTIRAGPQGGLYNMMGNPGSVAYDSKRQEILVPN
jgi:DNA-binding beta-propeller fold protein YncE